MPCSVATVRAPPCDGVAGAVTGCVAGLARRILDGARASAGRAMQLANPVEAKAGSPGFGELVSGIGKRPGRRLGQLEPIARDDRLPASASVVRIAARSSSRSDHRRIVARHVGDRERDDARRLRAARQPAALDARRDASAPC